ncbi:uncharacterized protein DNG_04432 [Cephalotrichum gorgonifer]|uniref:NmrA-like domain-containing protein n=1 Tax=Cephalotrichum gorgonifer TaxID=2041049 RepID=A0AAE8MY00_9PEZI|nr:uncharacterized protein DNG_04432 [Cephalotrichum gorgonifer]
MSTVAVAGGTGKLGRAVVNAINAAGKFEVLVLSRQVDNEKSTKTGTRVIAVDYTSSEAIASILEQYQIETLISTLGSFVPAQHEHNLIKGADKSSVTRRYIPNVWGAKHTEEIVAYYPAAAQTLGYLKALESTSLEWTAMHNGFFLDFYVAPEVQSYMSYMAIVVDLKNNFAAIPGSGDVPVVFTHSFDIGRFTAALLTKDKWEEESFIIGDKMTWNEFVRIGQEVKGTNFTVVYDSMEKLKREQVTELPSHPSLYPLFPIPKETLQAMFAHFGIMFENGALDITDHTLNEDFPDIKPRTVRELILEAYAA